MAVARRLTDYLTDQARTPEEIHEAVDLFTGDVAAVKAGLDAAAAAASKLGTVSSVQVIPRPHDDLSKLGSWIG